MARGIRKTPIQKLNEELTKTQEQLQNHKIAVKELQERSKQLQEKIKLEELKELSTILDDSNISIVELKDLIAKQG